jgi:hypothetical protein
MGALTRAGACFLLEVSSGSVRESNSAATTIDMTANWAVYQAL